MYIEIIGLHVYKQSDHQCMLITNKISFNTAFLKTYQTHGVESASLDSYSKMGGRSIVHT